jgi:septation ring formation regulator EzrA
MSLEKEDVTYIKEHLGQWLAECSLGKPPAVYEIELRERMVRVEEELKHQRELIKQILVEMDKRFDAVDKRFETVDKRFETVDKRFETVDTRFESLQVQMDKRFDALTRRIDRFMVWSFGITVSSAGIIIAVLRFWPNSP